MSKEKYYGSTEKNGGLKAAIVSLWILLVLVIAAGGFLTYNYITKLEKEHAIQSEPTEESTFEANVLICVEDKDNEDVSPQFLLIGFSGEAKTISVSEIPASIIITAADKTDTAEKLFNYGSASYLRDAIANHYGITIHKYFSCSLSEVETFVDYFGGIDYNIKTPMQQKNKEGTLVTNLVKGNQKLNGNQYCQFLRYDGWKSESEKAKNRVNLFTVFLNEYNSRLDSETILSVYKKIANNIDTDASIIDINDFSLMYKVFKDTENPASGIDIDFSDDTVAKVKIEKYYK